MIENLLFGLAFGAIGVFSVCITLIRYILKGVATLTVVVGAIVVLLRDAVSTQVLSALPEGYSYGVMFLLDHWWQVAILAVFVDGQFKRRHLLSIERDLTYVKMCTIATCSYLDFEPETQDVEEFRKIGNWEWEKQNFVRELFSIFLPFLRVDRLLFTHAARDGRRIKLGDDLRRLP